MWCSLFCLIRSRSLCFSSLSCSICGRFDFCSFQLSRFNAFPSIRFTFYYNISPHFTRFSSRSVSLTHVIPLWIDIFLFDPNCHDHSFCMRHIFFGLSNQISHKNSSNYLLCKSFQHIIFHHTLLLRCTRCVFVCALVKFFFWYLQGVFVVVVFFTWDDLCRHFWCVTTKCCEINERQTERDWRVTGELSKECVYFFKNDLMENKFVSNCNRTRHKPYTNEMKWPRKNFLNYSNLFVVLFLFRQMCSLFLFKNFHVAWTAQQEEEEEKKTVTNLFLSSTSCTEVFEVGVACARPWMFHFGVLIWRLNKCICIENVS